MSSTTQGLLYACVTASCWAVLAIGLKVALQFASAGTVVWFRMGVAFCLLTALFLFFQRSSLRVLKAWPFLAILAGVCLAGNYFGYLKGVEYTSASHTQVMGQLAPMCLVLIGVFYFKEVPTLKQKFGFLLALIGFSLFYWDQLGSALGQSNQFIDGNLWIIFAVLTWTLYATLQKLLTDKWSPQQINLIIYAVATAALSPLVKPSEFLTWNAAVWTLMLALGANTLIAYGALGEALKLAPASQVSMILALNPLITILLVTILRIFEINWIPPETIDWRGFIGALFVASGVAIAVRARKKVQANSN